MIDYRIISIGALSAHPLWGEKEPVRTGHSTTTLVRSRDRVIIVDPGLPSQALAARLQERAKLPAAAVTDVFLTSFRPDARRALDLFDDATWWIHNDERERVGVMLASTLRRIAQDAPGDEDDPIRAAIERDIVILQRCKPAPDHLADHVDIFPLPGVSPGTCGLLLEEPRATTLICGDAIPTTEHLQQGQVLPNCADYDKAKESFQEAVEIADFLILGRDNIVANPTRRAF
ncbi:MAG: MBL fold metallo-hydrolase [Phycisphaerales bacterium]|nr:MBL fold metallo-hydrolase [Phycisphaerales bacterium]